MLTCLRISNFALIDFLELEFNKGFAVITGETGSGKSILLNALDLILGARADFSVIGPDSTKSFVEAEFTLNDTFQSFFLSADLDFSSSTVIRREINTLGKSRAFINDTPVSLTLLRSLTAQLINIHSQYNTLELKEKAFQLDVLDCLAGLENEKSQFTERFDRWKSKKQLLESTRKDFEESVKWIDYNQFQLSELNELDLTNSDYQLIEDELNTLQNIESLKVNSYQISQVLIDENGVYSRVQSLKSTLEKSNVRNATLEEFINRLNALLPELKDIGEEAENFAEELRMDPDKISENIIRLDAFNRILTKHHKNSQDELIQFQNELSSEVFNADQLRENLEILEADFQQEQDELIILAGVLHHKRLSAISPISSNIQNILGELKMPDTLLLFQLSQSKVLSPSGNTEVNLLFSANKGIAPVGIEKAASGGELSRVMLALQKLISEKRQLPTILFDEIDTGVSGEVAHKMAALLGSMSANSQLIAITHLPQVAAKANHHAKVSKENKEDRISSKVSWLNSEQKIIEIARLMSGETITDAAIENAKNLILN